MSEQEQAQQPGTEAKPKKGKLKVIIIIAVVLAAGGFFSMKMKGGAGKKPEPKLGAMADLPKEFLVPLRGEGSYLRTDLALHFIEGYDVAHVEKDMPAIRDAIIRVLMSKSKRDLESLDDIRQLKKLIAAEVNKELAHEEEHPKEAEHEKGEKSDGKPAAEKPKEHGKDVPEKPKHPEWDSEEGPVLKVYFTTFATQ
jgi:flagellar basal body-associated protein FliL